MDERQYEYNKQYTLGAVRGRMIGTGAMIGIFFYLLWYAVTFFNFTEYPIHSYIQKSISLYVDIPKWLEVMIVGGITAVLSIFLAILYYVSARKWFSIWVGILYGLVIALLHMGVIHPLFYGDTLFLHSVDSTVTIVSMHILYGVSIGYSISFDYNDSLIYRLENNMVEK